MVSLWIINMMVGLDGQKEKLASATFARIHFWTEATEEYLVDLKDAKGAVLLYLKFWLEVL
jgi:hypothetical protein